MGSISVSHLGKAYKQYGNRWSRLLEWVWPFSGQQHRLKWVLQEINFQIAAGEAVGIIGVNGAGKSTLLKLITGTTQPTSGRVAAQGRIAALLELGMGFHLDFTGRQNIVSSGQLMGLSSVEIQALMPQIIAFAEIGDYIDEQVRVYSSGMQMRLAFAVATCVRPDILIVDEALAVGDIFFQQKCFARIKEFTDAGSTLLFVSHSSSTILNICDRCIFIKQGAVAYDGEPRAALDLYQAELLGRQAPAPQVAAVAPQHVPVAHTSLTPLQGKEGSIQSASADCVAVRFLDPQGQEKLTLMADEQVTLALDFRIHQDLDDPHPGFKIRDRFGVVMYETNSYCMHQTLGSAQAGSLLSVQFSFALNLFPSEYTITVGFANGGYDEGSFREVLCYLHEVSPFVVMRNPASALWAGHVNLQPQLSFEKLV